MKPESFDFEPYRFTIIEGQDPPWHMDLRHIQTLHSLAMALPHTAHIVEVGSYRGASTAAFVEAINKRPDLSLDCFDTKISMELMAVAGSCDHIDQVRLIESQLPDDLTGQLSPDLILIDADHGWPAYRDVAIVLAQDVPIIVMHDTTGIHGSFGSAGAWNVLMKAKHRCHIFDNVKRPGECTDRGLGISYAKHRHTTFPLEPDEIMRYWADKETI